jgi:hypothetical protein
MEIINVGHSNFISQGEIKVGWQDLGLSSRPSWRILTKQEYLLGRKLP